MTSLPVDPHLYLTFLGVMTVMAVTPGPANLFSVANGVQRGKAAAMAGVVGMNTATLVWFGAAALGLGALVVAFPAVFRLISIGGALYVAWLGINALRGAFRVGINATAGIDGTSETDGLEVTSAALGGPYGEGLLVVQDGHKRLPQGTQNFKLVPWRAVTGALKLH